MLLIAKVVSSFRYTSKVANQWYFILEGQCNLKWPDWQNAVPSDLQVLIFSSGQQEMTASLFSQQDEVDFLCKS